MSQRESFQDPETVPDLSAMVLKALSSLIAQAQPRIQLPAANTTMCPAAILERLVGAVTDPDRGALDRAADALNGLGVCDQTIANHHVPAVARALGSAWVDGTLEFSTVSIGCARMQGYLRQRKWDSAGTSTANGRPLGRALLCVPEFEQHTLGAILLAGQLRSAGVDVDLDCQGRETDLMHRARTQRYDAILVSSSQSETLGQLRRLTLGLKEGSGGTTIIVGGNILEQISNVGEQSGADYTAHCWQDALGVITSGARIHEAVPVGLIS